MKTVVAVVLLVLVTACGGPSASEKKAEAESKAKAAQVAEAAKKEAADAKLRAGQLVKFNACTAEIGPFADALQEINSRLAVGMNYSEYGDRIGTAKVAYDKIDIDNVSEIAPRCLNAAASMESSYNKFTGVLNIWGDCLDDYNCDFSEGSTNTKAQAGWVRAGTLLEKGKKALAGMEPTG